MWEKRAAASWWHFLCLVLVDEFMGTFVEALQKSRFDAFVTFRDNFALKLSIVMTLQIGK
jgi:hypothetical protein